MILHIRILQATVMSWLTWFAAVNANVRCTLWLTA
jgi:hypothetical protein